MPLGGIVVVRHTLGKGEAMLSVRHFLEHVVDVVFAQTGVEGFDLSIGHIGVVGSEAEVKRAVAFDIGDQKVG